MFYRHGIARSIGAFMALFAIVMATLLAPVHQAHAAQRDLARANGDLLGAQIICHGDPAQAEGTADPNSSTGSGSNVQCPVCSLGQQVGATPSPTLAGVPAVWGAIPAHHLDAIPTATSQPERTVQPRAPPIQV